MRCQDSSQRHGHTGTKEEYFLASPALWHTQRLLYLPGWAGRCNSPPAFSIADQAQPCSPSRLSSRVSPLYLPRSSSPSPISQDQISSSLSTAGLWCCPWPSKAVVLDHSSTGRNPLPKLPSLALLLGTREHPLTPFLGTLTLLPARG